MPRQRGGNLLILKPANYTSDPTRFPSSDAKVSCRGYAGTKSNVAAAAGEYVSYDKVSQNGGNLSYNANDTGPVGDITGPYAGPGNFKVNKGGPIPRLSGMGAGQSMKTIEQTLKSMPGGRRKIQKHTKKHYKKHSKTHTKKHYKKHSKTHTKKHLKANKKNKHSMRNKHKHTSKKYKGGNGQPYANVPLSFGYSLGGTLPGDLSALANPPPQHVYDNCQKNKF